MSSALIFVTGGIMKSYITGGILGGRGTIFNAIYANVVFGEVVHERQRKIFVV